jgi:membrane associated rhomboid family serine protease
VIPIQVSSPPTAHRPVATVGLVAVLVVVFVHASLLDQAPPLPYCTDLTESAEALRSSASTLQGFVCRWGAIPDDLHEGRALVTLVTSVFIHTSWLHLLFNLAFLGAFAPRVEEDLGHVGVLGVFLGSAVLGGAAHVLVVPNLTVPSIGASGGVAGVLGAHLLLAPLAKVRVLVGPVPVRLPTWFVLLLWVGPQLFLTAVVLRRAEYPTAVSYEVHAVGFLLGLLVAAAVLLARPDLRRWRLPQQKRSVATSDEDRPAPHGRRPSGTHHGTPTMR